MARVNAQVMLVRGWELRSRSIKGPGIRGQLKQLIVWEWIRFKNFSDTPRPAMTKSYAERNTNRLKVALGEKRGGKADE